MSYPIETICVFETNYVHLIHDVSNGCCAAVDPADPQVVADWLDLRGLKLSAILNTHHHNDHTGGNLALKARYGAKVYGFAADAARIPGLDIGLADGAQFDLFGMSVSVMATPGHTSGSVCYFLNGQLFTGDTLFAMGCGRLFEGDAATMLSSLSRITVLPDETKIFPGHNYALADARFAVTLEPDNTILQERLHLAEQGLIGAGFTLGAEKQTNPFLRSESAALRRGLGREGDFWLAAPDEAVLAEVRSRKDRF